MRLRFALVLQVPTAYGHRQGPSPPSFAQQVHPLLLLYGHTMSLSPFVVYNVSEDKDYFAEMTTGAAAQMEASSPGRLQQVVIIQIRFSFWQNKKRIFGFLLLQHYSRVLNTHVLQQVSVDYLSSHAAAFSSKLDASALPPIDTTTAAVAVDYAVKNVSVALCHPSTDIPSIEEYFTGTYELLV